MTKKNSSNRSPSSRPPQIPDRRCGRRRGRRHHRRQGGDPAERRDHARARPSAVRPSTQFAQAQISTPTVTDAHAGHPGLTDGKPGLRLHARLHQGGEHRLHLHQSRLELPRPARVDHHLRRQQEARALHRDARGIGHRDGARLLQGHRQARDLALPRHRRPAARRDGDLQRMVRPRARHHDDRQQPGCEPAPARRADDALGAGPRRDGARLHQVGRPADLAHPFRRIDGARLSHRDDAALRAGASRARRRSSGARRRRSRPAHSEDRDAVAAGRRSERGARSRAAARQCGQSGHRRRSRLPHAGRRQFARPVVRALERDADRSGRPHELPEHASALCARHGAGRAGRCDPRPRAHRLLRHGE